MHQTTKHKLLGWLALIILPSVLVVISIFYYSASQITMLFLTAVLALIYFGYLFTDVDTGPRYIRVIKIPQAPNEIEKLLKTTSNDGDLIFVYLLSAFEEEGQQLSKAYLVDSKKAWRQSNLPSDLAIHRNARKEWTDFVATCYEGL